MVFLSLPLIKLPSCKATSFRIWVHTSYVVACGIQPKAFFFIIYILLTVNLKSLSTIMCRSRSNHVPWGKGFIHSAMTRLEGMREFGSSGKDVSVNPRNWRAISSDSRRSSEEGIIAQFWGLPEDGWNLSHSPWEVLQSLLARNNPNFYSLMNMRQLHSLFNSAKSWHVIFCWFLCI